MPIKPACAGVARATRGGAGAAVGRGRRDPRRAVHRVRRRAWVRLTAIRSGPMPRPRRLRLASRHAALPRKGHGRRGESRAPVSLPRPAGQRSRPPVGVQRREAPHPRRQGQGSDSRLERATRVASKSVAAPPAPSRDRWRCTGFTRRATRCSLPLLPRRLPPRPAGSASGRCGRGRSGRTPLASRGPGPPSPGGGRARPPAGRWGRRP